MMLRDLELELMGELEAELEEELEYEYENPFDLPRPGRAFNTLPGSVPSGPYQTLPTCLAIYSDLGDLAANLVLLCQTVQPERMS